MTNSRLRILRVERGLRQIELALRCGINCARISHIENNLIEATPTEKQKIAKVLNVGPAEIWSERKDDAGNCLAVG